MLLLLLLIGGAVFSCEHVQCRISHRSKRGDEYERIGIRDIPVK